MNIKYLLILSTITFISNNLVYTMNVENNTEFENNYANNESIIFKSKLKPSDKNLYKGSENNTFNTEHDSIQHKKQEYKDDGVIFDKNGNDNNNINESVIFNKNKNNINKHSDNNNINESVIFDKNNNNIHENHNNINKNNNDNNDINESVIFGNNINESIIFDKNNNNINENHNNINKNSNDNNNINESIIFNKTKNNINKNSNDNNNIYESIILDKHNYNINQNNNNINENNNDNIAREKKQQQMPIVLINDIIYATDNPNEEIPSEFSTILNVGQMHNTKDNKNESASKDTNNNNELQQLSEIINESEINLQKFHGTNIDETFNEQKQYNNEKDSKKISNIDNKTSYNNNTDAIENQMDNLNIDEITGEKDSKEVGELSFIAQNQQTISNAFNKGLAKKAKVENLKKDNWVVLGDDDPNIIDKISSTIKQDSYMRAKYGEEQKNVVQTKTSTNTNQKIDKNVNKLEQEEWVIP